MYSVGTRGLSAACQYVLLPERDTSEAKPRPGMRRRSCAAVGRCEADSLAGARSDGPRRNSLRSLRSLRSNNRRESDVEARATRARPCALRSSAPHNVAAAAHPTHGFASTTEACVDEHLGGAARWAVPGGGRLVGRRGAQRHRGSPRPEGAGPARSHEAAARSAPLASGIAAALVARAPQRSRPAKPTDPVGAPPGTARRAALATCVPFTARRPSSSPCRTATTTTE